MPIVCGIRFRETLKTYYFAPGEFSDLQADDCVIVETTRGQEMGRVVTAPHEVPESEVVGELKTVLRLASSMDLVEAERFRHREDEATRICREQVLRMGLEMKISGAEYSYDGSRLAFFFTSEQRVDFRHLVRELAHIFKTRIELRQIGVRDEARIVGGVGKCGRPLCCATWLTDFSPVSIRMAKAQNLPLSPMEISGLCGRLLCCLTYEQDYYQEIKGRFPKVGKMVETPLGPAKVIRVSVLQETVTLLMADGATLELTADQLSGKEPIENASSGRDGRQAPLGDRVDQAVSATLERSRARSQQNASPAQPAERGRGVSDAPVSRSGQTGLAAVRPPRREAAQAKAQQAEEVEEAPQRTGTPRRRRPRSRSDAPRGPAANAAPANAPAPRAQGAADEAADEQGPRRPRNRRFRRRPSDQAQRANVGEPGSDASRDAAEERRSDRPPRRRRSNPAPRE
jgi:cell fate regulator YaaT (PSP1 superfamily)